MRGDSAAMTEATGVLNHPRKKQSARKPVIKEIEHQKENSLVCVTCNVL